MKTCDKAAIELSAFVEFDISVEYLTFMLREVDMKLAQY